MVYIYYPVDLNQLGISTTNYLNYNISLTGFSDSRFNFENVVPVSYNRFTPNWFPVYIAAGGGVYVGFNFVTALPAGTTATGGSIKSTPNNLANSPVSVGGYTSGVQADCGQSGVC